MFDLDAGLLAELLGHVTDRTPLVGGVLRLEGLGEEPTEHLELPLVEGLVARDIEAVLGADGVDVDAEDTGEVHAALQRPTKALVAGASHNGGPVVGDHPITRTVPRDLLVELQHFDLAGDVPFCRGSRSRDVRLQSLRHACA